MVMRKFVKMGNKPLVKKGLLSRLLDFLHAPSEDDIDTLRPVRDVSSSQQDARTKPPMDSPFVPADVERKMLAETEILKSRRPEQYARVFN